MLPPRRAAGRRPPRRLRRYDAAMSERDRHRARPGRLAAARRAALRRRPVPLPGRPGRRLAALAQPSARPCSASTRSRPLLPPTGRPSAAATGATTRAWPSSSRSSPTNPRRPPSPASIRPPRRRCSGWPSPCRRAAAATMSFRRIGWLDIPFPEGARRLALYWMEGYAGGLFVPFRDATNGTETYGAGRYLLDAAKSADLGGDPARADARSATSTSATSRRAPSIRSGPARSRHRRIGSTSRSAPANGSPDRGVHDRIGTMVLPGTGTVDLPAATRGAAHHVVTTTLIRPRTCVSSLLPDAPKSRCSGLATSDS